MKIQYKFILSKKEKEIILTFDKGKDCGKTIFKYGDDTKGWKYVKSKEFKSLKENKLVYDSWGDAREYSLTGLGEKALTQIKKSKAKTK
jgi:hypothetical protein